MVKKYLWNALISLDQLANVVFAPILNIFLRKNSTSKFGDPDETLSSVFGKNLNSSNCKWCFYMCKFLSLFDKRHCAKSIEQFEGRDAL